MTLADADLVIERLRAAVERVGANLVEVERDPHRQLLEAAALRGETAARWLGARNALADLFESYARMTAFVESVTELRRQVSFDPRRVPELDAMLTGPAIELSSSPVAISERGLLDGSRKITRCTADELLARMASDFEIARNVVFAVARVWDVLVPQVGAAREALARAEAQAGEMGDAWPELASVRRQLDALGEVLAEDPIAVDARLVDELDASAASLAHEIEQTDVLRREFLDRIAACRSELDALMMSGRALSDVEREAAVKIASRPPAEPVAHAAELSAHLDRVVELASAAQWRAAERELDAWLSAYADVRRQLEENDAAARAALAHRAELRGRLAAYSAKAAGFGFAEDAHLARLFDAAQEALYTAPTDLERAEALVRRYQDGVNAAPGRRGAM
jgi:hypothetical protein